MAQTQTEPKIVDPGAGFNNPKAPTAEIAYRAAVNERFGESPDTWFIKLSNFPKYVPRQVIARFLARYEIFKLVENVHGSIVECGVLYGGGLMAWANFSAIMEPYNFQRRIIGFDTFAGFPDVDKADLTGDKKALSDYLQVGGLGAPNAYEDLQEWIKLFDSNRIINHIQKIELVKGNFDVTCPQFLEQNPHLVISCLYLDFDLYRPTKLALENFLARMPKGAVIAFDELNDPMWPGETKAVIEMDLLKNLRVKRFPFHPNISYAVIGD